MNASMTMARRTPRRVTAEIAELAEKILYGGFRVLCGFCVLYASSASAAPPVRTMYTRALAQEQPVRGGLGGPDAAPALITDIHAVVSAYEAVVRHYPASGYSDDALWHSGRLALDAFARFAQAADRD